MPALREVVLSRLDQWRNSRPFPAPTETWPGLNQAVHLQDLIGWNHFLMGLLSPNWAAVQDDYYVWLGKRNTGKRWATLLIAKLLQVAWDMWDHRCTVRHAPNNPRQLKASSALDLALEAEMTTGVALLPESMWHYFEVTLLTLLGKPVQAKKQWLSAIEAGRRYALAVEHGVEVEETEYCEERAALRQWLRTGLY
jgi:hypothetical protein